ncbi:MAG: DNA mismatch repair protein MutS [Omnitrophica WOR_2 bacterium RIFOXYB2_FULL_38_16]|nr:MAG: DNA mismatch repair protein MutS [Omnitrophica WOR_2 bacterium RIFOXYA12_FULL_38_10]OGX55429.1 MAG: DNA mismatch repair protein MutS [Omnitrophica WOR_2 bacterium RIFOXYB2_FULL_38_16]HBG61325.1 DNA mismatch repair protein MutS [Candidatus Omnitrophota bacterium]
METTTPMLKQYNAIKAKNQDSILLFRLGDFYEMFFEDAKTVSKKLDIVLTSRGKGVGSKIPMCGFPHHAAENYIARLVKAGHKVAICEQMEDPSLAKGIVKRDITRIITSGTYLDEHSTDSRYLLCLSPNGKTIGVAFCDPTTGEIQTNQYPKENNALLELIAKLPVQECIFPESQKINIKELFDNPALKAKSITLSPFQDFSFSYEIARDCLCKHFNIKNLCGFGIEDLPSAASSTGALLDYLKQMNKQPLKHIDKVSLYHDSDFVFISPAALNGLELSTLIKTIDHTLTPLGKRKFSSWLHHPLKNIQSITERQKAIRLLLDNPEKTRSLKASLNKITDIEKNISRLSCGYIHAKDFLSIRNTLDLLPDIKRSIEHFASTNALFHVQDLPDLREYLCKTINESVPLSNPEGKIIKEGYDQELDSLRDIQNNGRKWLAELQKREIERTKINSLKIGFNKVFGYYLEVTKTNMHLVPQDFIRKQTLVNAERFITPELKEYEEKILTAQDKILSIENKLLKEIHQEILNNSLKLHEFCETIAILDCIYSLSVLAQSPNYIAPIISEDTKLFIQEGRHPVVEKTSTETFIANDTLLDCEDNHLIILTGPNMAGKSTYIRQTAILVIMAQAGSFIPARKATIGLVDKIFTRIGAHDDISKGQSTFMVEMNETADILNNLTDRSLIILDEIGRGTSTYDGLSLAWALAEHLASTKARTLFATHFHELTALADERQGIKNYNVAVKEWEDEVIFLHRIIPGSTDDSYGIYVAKLAGIPEKVIKRAKRILTQLELKADLRSTLSSDHRPKEGSGNQIDFFSSAPAYDPIAEEVADAIRALDINNLTPVEALNEIHKLKEKVS